MKNRRVTTFICWIPGRGVALAAAAAHEREKRERIQARESRLKRAVALGRRILREGLREAL